MLKSDCIVVPYLNLSYPLNLKILAKHAGINTLKLKLCFKEQYGMPVMTFLRETRLQKAKKLLQETDYPIHRIAAVVGYPNPANFATAYRKRFKYAPRTIRNHRKDGATRKVYG